MSGCLFVYLFIFAVCQSEPTGVSQPRSKVTLRRRKLRTFADTFAWTLYLTRSLNCFSVFSVCEEKLMMLNGACATFYRLGAWTMTRRQLNDDNKSTGCPAECYRRFPVDRWVYYITKRTSWELTASYYKQTVLLFQEFGLRWYSWMFRLMCWLRSNFKVNALCCIIKIILLILKRWEYCLYFSPPHFLKKILTEANAGTRQY